MAKMKAATRRNSVVITVPDPDQMEPEVLVNTGGTIQWRSETHCYPHFEIHFFGANPAEETTDKIFEGSDEAPVVLRLQNEGPFKYEIWQMKERGGEPKKSPPRSFRVATCGGCQP